MRTIKAYWWNQGPREGNFGDELSAAIVRVLARARVIWAPPEKADILAIGSILEPWFWPGQSAMSAPGVIWGAGRMYGEEPFRVNPRNVAAVRGPLSVEKLEGLSPGRVPTGDPGLLAEFFVTSREKRYALGLVPHWSQLDHQVWRDLADQSASTRLIDVCVGYEKVIQEIARCETIVSSSLHGLIVADALGIPNVWVTLGGDTPLSEANSRFKFADYYASIGAAAVTVVDISSPGKMERLIDFAVKSGVKNVAEAKERILKSFPL